MSYHQQTPRGTRSELHQSAASSANPQSSGTPFRISRQVSAPAMTCSSRIEDKEHINFDKWVCSVMLKVAQVVAEARFLPPLPKHWETVKRQDFFLETRIVKVIRMDQVMYF
jgi:hypothetical protein